MNEIRIASVLARTRALEQLARFGEGRAIFLRDVPADVDSGGRLYPRCIFDWQPELGAARTGTLTVYIVALDENAASPVDMGEMLRRELNGMAFGGDTACVLCWRGTHGFGAGLREHDAPKISGVELEFSAHEFTRSGGVEAALEQALGKLLGMRSIHDASPEGEPVGAQMYACRLTELRGELGTAGFAWQNCEISLYLPCADAQSARAAYDSIVASGHIASDACALLLEQTRLSLEADGCSRAQIRLSGRYNALKEREPAPLLSRVELHAGELSAALVADGEKG